MNSTTPIQKHTERYSARYCQYGLMLYVLAVSLVTSPSASAVEVVISSDTAISETNFDHDNKDVIVDGAILEVSGEHAFNSITLKNNAVLTHPVEHVGGMSLSVYEDVSVDDSSSIDVSKKGYGLVPGITGFAGASHGGTWLHDELGDVGTTNPTYGEISEPSELGSGTFAANGPNAVRGGGAVKLIARNIYLDGQINADGADAWITSDDHGGASGGSVWLKVNNLSGHGTISARGGDSYHYGGGGGGGRIAVYYNGAMDLDDSDFDASGGKSDLKHLHEVPMTGGSGTVYLVNDLENYRELLIHNIFWSNPVGVTEVSGAAADVMRGNGRVILNGVPSTIGEVRDTDIGARFLILEIEALPVVMNDKIGFYGEVYMKSAIPLDWTGADVFIDMSVELEPHDKSNGRLEIIAERVEMYGTIRASGMSRNFPIGIADWCGASHGGRGGITAGGMTNNDYGDPLFPISLGSDTSDRENESDYNRMHEGGGGAIKIKANELILNGGLYADGSWGISSGVDGHGAGGASGGSIWLDVGVLSGSGQISADGGGGVGGGGGGGRIAIHYKENKGFELLNPDRVSANGGQGGWIGSSQRYMDGEIGTIRLVDKLLSLSVAGSSPSGLRANSVSEINITFNTALDAASFTSDDIVIMGPDGEIPISGITGTDSVHYVVELVAPIVADGDYELVVGPEIHTATGVGMDQNANGTVGEYPGDTYQAAFTIDRTPPASPAVTNYGLSPQVIYTQNDTLLIQGSRETDTEVWLGGSPVVDRGNDDWTYVVSLSDGENIVSFTARDIAGNTSEAAVLRIIRDNVAPVVVSVTPLGDTYINAAPDALVIKTVETGSGVDVAATSLTVTRDGLIEPGNWALSAETLMFTPVGRFLDGAWRISGQLKDKAGLISPVVDSSFTLDRDPPKSPIVDPYPVTTNKASYRFRGQAEPYTSVRINETTINTLGPSGDWDYEVEFQPGHNVYQILSRDSAGNESTAVTVTVTYDDKTPDPVAVLPDGRRNGATISLEWSEYDEVAAGGDIMHYTVYQSDAPFLLKSEADPIHVVPAGTKSYTVSGLIRGHAYYFAVVASDLNGNALVDVTPVRAVAEDIEPPAEVRDLELAAFADHIQASWTEPSPLADDLAGYRVYLDEGFVTELPANSLGYDLTDRATAAGYQIKVTTIDKTENESSGVRRSGATLLPNPTDVDVTALDSKVSLTWSAVIPGELVSNYALYVQPNDFDSVEGLTPTLTVAAGVTSAQVAALTNGTPYYFAVTTINISGGQTADVTAHMATPGPDEDGPEISLVSFDGIKLVSGATLTHKGRIKVTANDLSGVGRVAFQLDGILLAEDINGEDGFSTQWDVATSDDGPHSLTVVAYDVLDNETSQVIDLTIALAPPAAPVMNAPSGGTVTNNPTQVLSGTAPANTEVRVQRDGIPIAGPVTVAADGRFALPVALVEGDNTLTATAHHPAGRGDSSPPSNTIVVSLDTKVPDAPFGLTARSEPQGMVVLSWNVTSDERVVGYRVYRSGSSFDDPSAAVRANTAAVTRGRFDDLPDSDGSYHYGVVAVNEAGTESALSNEVNAVSDRVRPFATNIQYTPSGAQDPVTGRMAPGRVQVDVTVNEPLLTTPFMSVTPDGGVPMAVELSKSTETLYTGYFDIESGTVSGTASAVFSARDLVGQQGTNIEAGNTILIDTDGPEVTQLELTPAAPIKTDPADPAHIVLLITLDQPVAPGTTPQLSYLLSADGRTVMNVPSLTKMDDLVWRGEFTLPADAGVDAVETLQFLFTASDDLGNDGTRIHPVSRFQVYEGDLPPAEIPRGLSATAMPNGQVALTWSAVEEAAIYQLYRQGPDEAALTPYTRSVEPAFIDDTTTDGQYRYAVASVRQANGQETPSEYSEPVTVLADATPPAPPINLTASLTGSGVLLLWDRALDAGDEELSYRIYRSNGSEIIDVVGLTPLAHSIVLNEETGLLGYVDGAPAQGEGAYTVTAVDPAGNESPPADSYYLNIDLLPVASLSVELVDGSYPLLSWSHAGGNIVGYNLYLADDPSTPLNVSPLATSTTSYQDLGYTGGVRDYIVTAVDAFDVESPGRPVTLTPIDANLLPGSTVRRGVFNRLTYEVINHGDRPVTGVQLLVGLADESFHSDRFDLEAGEVLQVEVVVGGKAGLPDLADLQQRIQINTQTGERTTLTRSGTIVVSDDTLLARVEIGELARGTAGQVRFMLENTSPVQTEILTAKSTTKASDQIQLYLRDTDGNVLSTAWVNQAANSVLRLPDGRIVARIPPGGSFVSDWQALPVPLAAPDAVQVQIDISQLHYNLGRDGEASIGGLSARLPASLVDTAYTATVTDISPENSLGDQPVVITGQAVDRSTGEPLPGVPIRLVLSANGYERQQDVLSDASGNYRYEYRPKTNDSGIYTVSAIHPDMFTRPAQGSFKLNSILVAPTELTLTLGKNYTHDLDLIKVITGEGTVATNVRLVYDAADQPGGAYPSGVTLVPGSSVTLGPKKTKALSFKLTPDNTADASGTLKLKVYSDETGTSPLAEANINYTFVDAKPKLIPTPGYIDTGVAHDSLVNETITLENRGLAELLDVQVSLVDVNGDLPPDWIYLISPQDQGDLAVGEKREIQLAAAPSPAVFDGNYPFKLRVTSGNYPQQEIAVYVTVTQSGIGNMLFHASDIYTATEDASGQLIQGLAGAKIRVQNEDTLVNYGPELTDADGVALFSSLPTGRYRFRASAPNHQDVLGSFSIKPDVTGSTEVFLDYDLVTVEWLVTEIALQDKYEITLQAIFETDVPAPVVVMEPQSTTLPDMAVGDVFYGEIRLTNYGLVRADNVRFDLPENDAYFRYEMLAKLPTSLGPKDSVVIPYRVTAIAPTEPDGTASGAGCYRYIKVMTCAVDYVCANGEVSRTGTLHTWTKVYDPKSCPGHVTAIPVEGAYSGGGGGGGGWLPRGRGVPSDSLSGARCIPTPHKRDCQGLGGAGGGL